MKSENGNGENSDAMPYEEGKRYKGRKTIATLVDINCQVYQETGRSEG